jgi:hypothetical protein
VPVPHGQRPSGTIPRSSYRPSACLSSVSRTRPGLGASTTRPTRALPQCKAPPIVRDDRRVSTPPDRLRSRVRLSIPCVPSSNHRNRLFHPRRPSERSHSHQRRHHTMKTENVPGQRPERPSGPNPRCRGSDPSWSTFIRRA